MGPKVLIGFFHSNSWLGHGLRSAGYCFSIVVLNLRFPDRKRRISKTNSRPTLMYLIPIAWLYVTVMMAVAEATNSNGTVLGGLVTFVLYGLLPIGLLLYFMGTPARKRARLAAEAREGQAQAGAEPAPQATVSGQPDTSSKAATDPVAPARKEP
jgi:hypothetical protein